MPWVKTADRTPPERAEVMASNERGTIMPMTFVAGEWFYRISNRPTKFRIVAWLDREPEAPQPGDDQ